MYINLLNLLFIFEISQNLLLFRFMQTKPFQNSNLESYNLLNDKNI